jgi:hypothetical protein
MELFTTFFAILIGFILRLAVPIVATCILIYFLRKLDARWQADAKLPPTPTQKIECWKINGGSLTQPEKVADPSMSCWQVYRQPNGYLQEECISCEVFINAPIPALKNEPRRI